MKDEFNQPKEYDRISERFEPKEFFNDVNELFEYKEIYSHTKYDETKPDEVKKETGLRNNKIRKMIYLVSATLSTVVLTNAVDPEFSILKGLNPTTIEASIDSEEETEEKETVVKETNETEEKPKVVFPKLGNLEPNGFVPGYGVLNEEYIYLVTDGTAHYVYAGKAYTSNGYSTEMMQGVTYDKASNTLTLKNVSAEQLNINLMGNGFTVKLEGENHIKEVLAWGFGYGGSITFTGEGKLIASGDSISNIGIAIEAEYSTSCIMVDSGVTLDISGSNAAIIINNTAEPKGLYYLEPQEMTGGSMEVVNAHDGYVTYAVVENGELSKHVVIKQNNK